MNAFWQNSQPDNSTSEQQGDGKRPKILKIDASGRYARSVSRQLTDYLVERLQQSYPGASLITRDLALGLPYVDEDTITAYNTPAEQRTSAQQELLETSDRLIEELKVADLLVLGVPMYNFTIPATLKAYIDLVVRSRVTFRFTENGPVGLLPDKKTYIVVTTGGTELFSPQDYLSDYLRYILSFIGIRNVEMIAADGLIKGGEEKIAAIRSQIDQLIPVPANV